MDESCAYMDTFSDSPKNSAIAAARFCSFDEGLLLEEKYAIIHQIEQVGRGLAPAADPAAGGLGIVQTGRSAWIFLAWRQGDFPPMAKNPGGSKPPPYLFYLMYYTLFPAQKQPLVKIAKGRVQNCMFFG